NAAVPTVNLAANRSTTLLTASNGMSCLRMGETTAYRFSEQPASGTSGCTTVFFADGRVLSATAYPQGDPACYETVLAETATRYLATTDRLRLITEVSLSESDACEQRTLTLQNRSSETLEGDLVVFLEPLCGSEAEDRAHPAFYRLFLTTEAVKHGVVAVRRNRMGERLCALAMICDDADAVFTTDGDACIGADDPSFADSFAQAKAEGVFGEVRFPVFRMRIPIKLAPHGEKTVRFVLALGSTALAANAVGERILSRPFTSASYASRMAEKLMLTPTESTLLPEMLAKLWFGGERTELPEPTDKDALWALGIGGDVPIVLVDAFSDNNERAGTVFRAVRMHALLAACGVRFDLCLLLDDGNAYERNGFRLCHSAIRLAQAGHLVGTLGGIHLIDLSAVSPRSLAALKLAACADFPPNTSPIPTIPVRRLPSHAKRPRIWSQPLCNAKFGCLSTDFGLTHLWYKNARMVKLTPWESEENGEQLCVLLKGRRISLTSGAECRFEAGYTVWCKQIDDRWFETRVCVAANDAVRIVKVSCEGGAVLEWMVSPLLAEHNIDRKAVVCRTVENGCIIAENPFLRRFGSIFAAFTVSLSPTVQTCSAADWRGGFSATRPIGQVAAFRLSVPSDVPSATFTVAASDNADSAIALAKQYANTSNDLFAEAKVVRRRQTQNVVISSDCAALNAYLNDWVVWQIKGSRLFSRSSLYQNGGAIGFRDQLQDAMSLLLDEPEILRSLVCLCAAHQYAEGDVQHWFHVGFADNQHFNGVRTRCSDDLLWLPLAVSEYVARTGDLSVLAERIPFLSSPPLADGEHERYEDALASEDVDTLYVHCLRALRRFFIRGTGTHGLPLILDGDWNDGMNAVGRAGKGESVWLAWFGAWVARGFAAVCDRLDDPTEAETLRTNAAELVRAAYASFASDRFARAYTDDGTAIGTVDLAFCQIDSIAQSFAWFAADGSESEEERRQMQTALQSALSLLVDRELGIVRLFDPPMSQAETIGYLGAYPRGVRENGGQYTHAAVWLAMACFAADRADDGWEILQMLLPATHDPAIYGGEDFVLAADVGGEGNFAGVCGWSWYSGSAAWFRRAVLESMLGIRGLPDGLCITPNLPSALPKCTCRLKIGGNT
ncbi:MAG: hypothetical protein IKU55_03990, partial [Clostridia bacterium]|nr:hypothetical protein [Clostridia bacterium]